MVALEEHVETGGLGSLMSDIFVEEKIIPKNFLKLNLSNKYSTSIGNKEFLREKYKIDSNSLVDNIKSFYE